MIVSIPGTDAKGNPAEFEAGFKFNNYTFEIANKMNMGETEVSQTLSIMYCAYRSWCFVKKIDERLTFENFSDWFESALENEMVLAQIKEILAEGTESQYVRNANAKKNELLNQNEAA